MQFSRKIYWLLRAYEICLELGYYIIYCTCDYLIFKHKRTVDHYLYFSEACHATDLTHDAQTGSGGLLHNIREQQHRQYSIGFWSANTLFKSFINEGLKMELDISNPPSSFVYGYYSRSLEIFSIRSNNKFDVSSTKRRYLNTYII